MARRLDWDRAREENQFQREKVKETGGVAGGPRTQAEAERKAQPVKRRLRRRRAKLAAALAPMVARKSP
jgi:hypothetical protein